MQSAASLPVFREIRPRGEGGMLSQEEKKFNKREAGYKNIGGQGVIRKAKEGVAR